MTEAEDLYSQRGQLLETIAAASDGIKAIDARLELLRSIEFEENIGHTCSYEQGIPLALETEISYVVKDIKKWYVDPDRLPQSSILAIIEGGWRKRGGGSLRVWRFPENHSPH